MFGLTKTYAAGAFSPTAVDAFMSQFKASLITDGAHVAKNDIDGFRWGPAFAQASTQADDTPFWQFTGAGDVHANAYIGTNIAEITASATVMVPAADAISLYAAADASHGWWWMAAQNADTAAAVTVSAGVSSRRYPADTHAGLVARYGLINFCYGPPWPRLCVPYAVNASTAARQPNAMLSVFSPLGYRSAIRQAGSPLPRMIAPLYPATGYAFDDNKTYTPAVMGELDAMMLATDGYAWAEVAQPGWRVFGDNVIGFFALRSPEAFTTI